MVMARKKKLNQLDNFRSFMTPPWRKAILGGFPASAPSFARLYPASSTTGFLRYFKNKPKWFVKIILSWSPLVWPPWRAGRKPKKGRATPDPAWNFDRVQMGQLDTPNSCQRSGPGRRSALSLPWPSPPWLSYGSPAGNPSPEKKTLH
jgi:hypothetical protein